MAPGKGLSEEGGSRVDCERYLCCILFVDHLIIYSTYFVCSGAMLRAVFVSKMLESKQLYSIGCLKKYSSRKIVSTIFYDHMTKKTTRMTRMMKVHLQIRFMPSSKTFFIVPLKEQWEL